MQNYIPVETGVVLEYLPYIAIVVVAVVGLVVFLLLRRKKRNQDKDTDDYKGL